jgi:hypothetical protein
MGTSDNSGIHSYAAFRIMTAKAKGKYLFTQRRTGAMFYIGDSPVVSYVAVHGQPACRFAGGAIAIPRRERLEKERQSRGGGTRL